MYVLSRLFLLAICWQFIGCSGGTALHSEGSSEPINDDEEKAYKAALIRCHKNGGTRVVKIAGKLRCF